MQARGDMAALSCKAWPAWATALCLLLAACVPHRGRAPAPDVPRAAPAYVQWLERQSMLGVAPEYTTLVSGTDMLLRAPSVDATSRPQERRDTPATARGDRLDALLEAADTWLFIHPATLLTTGTRTVWEELTAGAAPLERTGVRGVYVAPVAEGGAIWGYDRRREDSGDDATSLYFAPHMGSDGQFEAFATMAARRNWQLGMDIVPPATGRGPDFILAAQQVRSFPGTYIMVEIPDRLWAGLPTVEAAWASTVLEGAQAAVLVEAGLLPPALARDLLPWAVPGGWAVTGEIRGVDGRVRRWAYRYHGTPAYPVLSWDDPSGGARKIFSASIIRQVGVLQQTLSGLHMEPLLGLDAVQMDGPAAAAEGRAPREGSLTLEPGPSALRDMAREIRRYGGWSVQRDALPTALLAAQGRDGVDFANDGTTAAAAAFAMITGDAAPLQTVLAQALASGADARRAARTLSPLDGWDMRGIGPEGLRNLQSRLDKFPQWRALLEEAPHPRLYLSGAAAAALGAGLGPEAIPTPAAAQEIHRRQRLLASFLAGLPGLLFVTGQELIGALPLPEGTGPARLRGAWALNVTAAGQYSSRQGMPRASAVHGSFSEQTQSGYLEEMRSLLELRRCYGVARAAVIDVPRLSNKSVAGVLTQLPQGAGTLLVLANFSEVAVQAHVMLPAEGRGRVYDVLGGGTLNSASDSVLVSLRPLECRWLRIGGQSISTLKCSTEDAQASSRHEP